MIIGSIIGGLFSAIGSAVTAVGSAIGIAGAGASITAFGTSLAAGSLSAWGTLLLVGSSLASVIIGLPKPKSLGEQLSMQLDPGAPVPVGFGRTATGGNLVYREAFGDNNDFVALQVVLSAGGPIEDIEAFYGSNFLVNWNADPFDGWAQCTNASPTASGSKLYKNNMYMHWKLGAQPETAYSIDGYAQMHDKELPYITNASALSGLATAMVVYQYDTGAYPSGPPTPLWVGSFNKCYDPRLDSTYPGGSGTHRIDDSSTFTFSENPFICALNWCIGRFENNFKVWGIGAPSGTIDFPAFVGGANVADANGWKCGGIVTTGDDKYSVLTTILQAGGAQPLNKAGLLSVTYNAPKTSLYDVNPEDVIGSVQVTNTTAWRDRKNRIIPQYREENQFWNIIAGQMITANAFVAEDGGQYKTIQTSYPMVQDAAQAHQLAAYDLCNTREFLTFTMICKPRLLNARVGDCVTLYLPEVGANGQKCLVVGRSFDPSNFQTTLTLRSETDSKHAFALGQSQVAPAPPELTAYDPSNPDQPGSGAWSITGTGFIANGVAKPAIIIDGLNDDVNAKSVIAEFRPYGTSLWLSYAEVPFSSNGAVTEFRITSVIAGEQYEAAISYRTVRDVVGARLILGPVTAGDDIISWTTPSGNSAVYNLPIGLTTNSNGMLSANNIVYAPGDTVEQALTEALATANAANVALTLVSGEAANAIALATTAQAQAANAVANATTALSGLYTLASNVSVIANTVTVLTSNIAGANATITAVEVAQASNNATFTSEITILTANVAGANASILSFKATQAANDAVIAGEITVLNANVAGANATITSDRVAQASNNTTFASEISVLQANAVGANATITSDRVAQAANNATFATDFVVLTANVAGANSAISSLLTAQASNNATFASEITSLNANVVGANATITSDRVAQAANNASIATSLNSLTATIAINPNVLPYGGFEQNETGWTGWASGANVYNDANYGIVADCGTATNVFAITSGMLTTTGGTPYTLSGYVTSQGPGNTTSYLDRQYFWANGVALSDGGQTALTNAPWPVPSTGPNYVYTETTPPGAAFVQVRAVFNAANATSTVTGYARTIKLEAGNVATLYNTYASDGAIGASVTANAVALATLSGQTYGTYTLTASANNAIAGMSLLAATGNTNISSVIFNANSFQIWNGLNTKNLFSVSGGQASLANVVVNGNLLVANTVTAAAMNVSNLAAISANLGTLAVNGSLLVNSSVTASALNVTSLSAITANLGTIMVSNANITNLTIGTGQITNFAVTQPVTAFTANNQTITNVYTTIQTVNITTSGGVILVNAFFMPLTFTGAGLTRYNIQIVRGSTVVYSEFILFFGESSQIWSSGCTMNFEDTPSASAYTYTLQVETSNVGDTGSPAGDITLCNAFLSCLEIKK